MYGNNGIIVSNTWGRGGKFKLPTLSELHEHLFSDKFQEAHNATADVELLQDVFELIRVRSFSKDELLLDDEQYAHFFDKNKCASSANWAKACQSFLKLVKP